MNERAAMLRAICEEPEDSTRRLAFADYLDENDDPREAALQRVIARPADDGLRFRYAEVIESADSDSALHAEVVRVMTGRPEWFRDREWRDFYTSQPWQAERHESVNLVHQNLDLIAWADLSIRTSAIPGAHVWHRGTGGDAVHDDIRVTFSRGFVSDVRTTLGTFLAAAGDLFRHPVERVELAGKRARQDIHGRWRGWWDHNLAIHPDADVDNAGEAATLTTDLMLLMCDDPRRCDATLSLRFERDKRGMGGCIMFANERDANSAISRAAVLYGRRLSARLAFSMLGDR